MNRVHEQCPKNLTRENTESKQIENGPSAPSAQPAASLRAQTAHPATPRPRAPRAPAPAVSPRTPAAAPRAPAARPPVRSAPARCCCLCAPRAPAFCRVRPVHSYHARAPRTHARPARPHPSALAPAPTCLPPQRPRPLHARACARAVPRALRPAQPVLKWAVAHFRFLLKKK